MGYGTPAVLVLLLLWTADSDAKPHWRHSRHSPSAWANRGAFPTHFQRNLMDIGPLDRRYGQGHVHSRHVGDGGRAAAMAGGGGPWMASTTHGRDGAWAVSGGGPDGSWAVTSGGRDGPWIVSNHRGRYSLYAMNGMAWPGAQWPLRGVHWPRPSLPWPVARSPSHGTGHHGWGVIWHNRGRSDCGHAGRQWPSWGQPEEEPDQPEQPEQPEQQEPEEPEEDAQYPDETEGSGLYPEEPPRLPPVFEEPEEAPGVPEEAPAEPEEAPLMPTEAPLVPEPTRPEKTDCPEGAVFLDGDCVCPDDRPFLDTILSRCVDVKPVIH